MYQISNVTPRHTSHSSKWVDLFKSLRPTTYQSLRGGIFVVKCVMRCVQYQLLRNLMRNLKVQCKHASASIWWNDVVINILCNYIRNHP